MEIIIEKFNPYHDKNGRFTSPNGGGVSSFSLGSGYYNGKNDKAHANAVEREKNRTSGTAGTENKVASTKEELSKAMNIARTKGVVFEESFNNIEENIALASVNKAVEIMDKTNLFGYDAMKLQMGGMDHGNATGWQLYDKYEKTQQVHISANSESNKSVEAKINHVRNMINDGWWVDIPDGQETAKTMAHEMSHAIESRMFLKFMEGGYESRKENYTANEQKKLDHYTTTYKNTANNIKSSLWARLDYNDAFKESEKIFVKKIKTEIGRNMKKVDKKASVKEQMSEYGMTSPKEFFAEAGAQYFCGADTPLAKAFGMTLKDYGVLTTE